MICPISRLYNTVCARVCVRAYPFCSYSRFQCDKLQVQHFKTDCINVITSRSYTYEHSYSLSVLILWYEVFSDLWWVQTKTSRNLTSLQVCNTVGYYCCHPVIFANWRQVQFLIFFSKIYKSRQLQNCPENPIYWLPTRTQSTGSRPELNLLAPDQNSCHC